jgi:ribosomal protein L37AE/L43A
MGESRVTFRPWTVACFDCGEAAVKEKELGLWECMACGELTLGKQPIQLPPRIAGNWRRK